MKPLDIYIMHSENAENPCWLIKELQIKQEIINKYPEIRANIENIESAYKELEDTFHFPNSFKKPIHIIRHNKNILKYIKETKKQLKKELKGIKF